MGDNHPYSYARKFEGKIWKILSNKTGAYLAVEVRDESIHQVSFYIYDTDQRRWLWEEVTFEEQWWINLHAFGERELQFIYYEDGSSPDKKQYLTVDIDTKEVKEKVIDQVVSPILSPTHYLESTDHFTTVAKFLQQKLNISPVKAVDYLETQGVIVISYYIWQEDHLANFLLMVDELGEVKSHLLLADDLQTIGIDTFFVLKSSLFTIRNKAELLIYDI